LVIADAITQAGMTCTVTTGGYRLSAETARRMHAAGIRQCSVSVDGLEATHDRLRGRVGSFRSCLATFEHLRAVGVSITCNTQLNRLTVPELRALYDVLLAVGVEAWQLQMTVPMGNAADNADLLLHPAELLDVFPVLGDLAARSRRDGMRIHAGNNVGYYGPY